MSLLAGIAERDKGIDLAASCRTSLLHKVRSFLERVALERSNRCVTIDDAESLLLMIGKTHADLGNAAGSVFKYGAWELTGETAQSTRTSNHARRLMVWRLK